MRGAALACSIFCAMNWAASLVSASHSPMAFPVDMLPAFLVNLAYRVVAEDSPAPEGCRIRCLALLGEMGEDLARGQELDLAPAAPVFFSTTSSP